MNFQRDGITRNRTAYTAQLESRDGDLFHQINNDDRVMEFFPFRSDRQQADEMRRNLTNYISKSAYGFAAVEIKNTGECVGFNGLFLNSAFKLSFQMKL